MRAVFLILVACALSGPAACSSDKKSSETEEQPAGGSAETPATAASTAGQPTAADQKSAPATHFSYPPEGPGPHQGFDLAALRQKLQGAWLVGGTAFSSIPYVWNLVGDDLTIVDARGKQSKMTMRLLSPCYLELANPADGLREWQTFVIDGDTLYQGLGSSGLRQGDRTIACVAAGNYVLEGDSCTMWTRKPFPREGENPWQSQPGKCGYTEDGKRFEGDDSGSKRPIYGVEGLDVQGDILLTRQMAGNKAEKMASFEAALAKQKELIQAKEELKKTPELAFMDWKLPAGEVGYAAGDRVWACGANRQDKWSFNLFRFDKSEGDTLHLQSGWEVWAPSAFAVRAAPATGVAKGAPVMVAGGAFVSYGRFVKVDGDKLVVESLSGRKVAPRQMEPDRVKPLVAGEWSLGAPVAYRAGDLWLAATVVFADGDQVYIRTGKGVEPRPRAELRLIDVKQVYRKGAKVMAEQASGFSPLHFVSGKVTEVHGKGAAYTIKTDDGTVFEQSYDRVSAPL